MRTYTDFMGHKIDLDKIDYTTYPPTIETCRTKLFQEIGRAKVYVIARTFHESVSGQQQIQRVDKFIHDLAVELGRNWQQDLKWWHEKLYLFLDEVENMC